MTYPESEREPERQPGSATPPPAAPPPESWEQPARGASRWTGGRIASLVIGSVLAIISAGLLIVGGIALVIDRTQRDDDGYLSFGTDTFSTQGYALASERIELRGVDWDRLTSLLGDFRIRVTSTGADESVFVGITPADDADRYLTGVEHTVVRDLADGDRDRVVRGGGPPSTPPGEAGIWTVEVSGPGTQTLVWPAESGDWVVVAMNQDASSGVSVRVQTAATLPALLDFAIWSLVAGAVLLAVAVVLIVIPVRRASAERQPPESSSAAAYPR